MPSRSLPAAGEVALFAEAGVALALASIAVRLWPFRWIVRSAGLGGGRGNVDPAPIGLAIGRASRRLPWRVVCFQQGLAAHWMLRRRGARSRLHYGLRSEERLSAHVWVTLDGQPVIGEEESDPHACVAIFPPLAMDG